MKRVPTKGNIIRNWLSGTSRSDEVVSETDCPGSSSISRLISPPPLTDSSSVTEASTGLITPKTVVRHVHPTNKHTALGEKRSAVPTRYAPAPKQLPSHLRLPPPQDSQHPAAARREPATRQAPVSQPAHSFHAKTPRTPPKRHIDLPAVTQRQTTLSLPPNAPRPFTSTALVVPPRIAANQILRFSPSRRTLMYNLVMPPCNISQLPSPSTSTVLTLFKPKATSNGHHKPHPLSPLQLSEPATTPPTRHIRLNSDHWQIPWPIDIRSRASANAFVTVGDFIYELYSFLQVPITREEWDNSQKDFREEVKRARERRCVDFVDAKIKSKDFKNKDPLRRIDFFLDMTMFAGLQRRDEEEVEDRERNDGGTTWLLMLEPRP